MEKDKTSPVVDESRRKFLEKAGKASVAAPAAALLLSAGVQAAANPYGDAGTGGGATCEFNFNTGQFEDENGNPCVKDN